MKNILSELGTKTIVSMGKFLFEFSGTDISLFLNKILNYSLDKFAKNHYTMVSSMALCESALEVMGAGQQEQSFFVLGANF